MVSATTWTPCLQITSPHNHPSATSSLSQRHASQPCRKLTIQGQMRRVFVHNRVDDARRPRTTARWLLTTRGRGGDTGETESAARRGSGAISVSLDDAARPRRPMACGRTENRWGADGSRIRHLDRSTRAREDSAKGPLSPGNHHPMRAVYLRRHARDTDSSFPTLPEQNADGARSGSCLRLFISRNLG